MLHGYICNYIIQNMQMKMNQMLSIAKADSGKLETLEFSNLKIET